MTLQEIKQSIAEGKKVYWKSKAYEVRRTKNGIIDFYLFCVPTGSIQMITEDFKEEDFFHD